MKSRSVAVLTTLIITAASGAAPVRGAVPTAPEVGGRWTETTLAIERTGAQIRRRPSESEIERERQRLVEAGVAIPPIGVLIQWVHRMNRCLNDPACRTVWIRIGGGVYLVAVKAAQGVIRVYQGNRDLVRRIAAEAERDPVSWGQFLMRLFTGVVTVPEGFR